MQPPRFLYHSSPVSNRESILEHGLLRSRSETAELARDMGDPEDMAAAAGGIFFSLKRAVEDMHHETWEVDVSGLNLEIDETTDVHDSEDFWWVIWDDVPPERLRLLPHDAEWNVEPLPFP